MEPTVILLTILIGTLLVGLAAIWKELRLINSARRARRESEHVLIPMSTGLPVKPTQSIEVSGRAEDTFKPDRLAISNAGTTGGAQDWIVNDIKIAGKSIFLQSGDIPGDLFSTKAADSFLTFRTIEPGQSVRIIVTYIGRAEQGVPFFAALIGRRSSRKVSREKRRARDIVETATA